VIGLRDGGGGSLRDFGVSYRQVDLLADGSIDYPAVAAALADKTAAVLLQRSRGYNWGPSLGGGEMKKAVALIKEIQPGAVVIADNCYGEFVETEEPLEGGADLAAGSLIKNPGGGLAPTGGYIVGRKRYVDAAAGRWSAPGLGKEVGPAPEGWRLLFQGLFLAPHIVAETLKGMVFAARFLERLGFPVLPDYQAARSDIVQAIGLGTPERMIAFCRGIQGASPVDAHVRPEPSPMPGYEDQVIMAAGTFVQGASLELSADGPLRPPYVVYLQGGLSKEYVKLALLNAVRELAKIKAVGK
jgi:cystathionine beta-lyase family protein involved in aluminum resistance